MRPKGRRRLLDNDFLRQDTKVEKCEEDGEVQMETAYRPSDWGQYVG